MTAAPGSAPPAKLRAGAGELAYAPALDGLRGLCLIGVLLFHAPFSWASGGFLGVSTFFTLSGYLITSLLLLEGERTGRISFRAFFERRLRRLLPALVVAVLAVLLTAPLWLPSSARERLGGDAAAALLFLSNFRFMSPQRAYSQLFAAPSPFQHCWSLAIEGQFYLLFPGLVAAVLRSRAGRRGLAWAVLTLLAASLAVALSVSNLSVATYRVYYGSDARAAELLIGACLGLFGARIPRRLRGALGGAALTGILLAWGTLTVGSPLLYRGGFALYALLSALVVAAATEPRSAVATALSPAWLRWIGRTSYGAYVYHWPVFLLLDPERTGLSPVPLLALRCAATFSLAGLSFHLLEEPIRRRRILTGPRFAWSALVAVAAVVGALLLESPWTARVEAARVLASVRGAFGLTAAPPSFRFAFFGDSTALSLSPGLGAWLALERGGAQALGSTHLGCGLLYTGSFEHGGRWLEPKRCANMPARWTDTARQRHLDLAVVLVGPWEVTNRRLRGTAAPMALGDARLDARMRTAVEAAIAGFADAGAKVVWLTSPRIAVKGGEAAAERSDRDSSRPERMDRLNEIVRDVAAEHPDVVRVVDLAGLLRRRRAGELDPEIRPDGVHLSTEGALRVAWQGLGAEVWRAYQELRRDAQSR